MFQKTPDPQVAAQHLLKKINARPGSVSISSYWMGGEGVALKVYLPPEFKSLKAELPHTWEGYKVLCEISSPPTASIFY